MAAPLAKTDEDAHRLLVKKVLLGDFEKYAFHCLKIVPKAGGIEPFVLNACQRYVHQKLEAQLKAKGYIRARILKARQWGCSTYVEGRFYKGTTTARGKRCLVVAHEDKATTNLFNMTKHFHDHCLHSKNISMKPETRASNAIELVFNNSKGTGLNSRFIVQTASGKGGRGQTTHFLHLSEYAHYGDAAMGTVGGALESIPSEYPAILGTEIIQETTANGVGEPFHRGWVETKQAEAAGKPTDYINIFVPWFFHEGYARPIDETERRYILGTLDEDEKWLLEQHDAAGEPVDVSRLAWRRWKIQSVEPPAGYTKEDFFRQEYPATDEEAFVFSGSQVFPAVHLKTAKSDCWTPGTVGGFEFKSGDFVKKKGGNLRIWQPPKPGALYVIGVDVAEGLVDGDFSVADVLRAPDGLQVAQWHGHIDPDLFGQDLFWLGCYYGRKRRALIGVEANNHGHTTIAALNRLRYPNLYMRETLDSLGKKIKKHGWLTTRSSKPYIIDMAVAALRDGKSGITCFETVQEMSTFSKLPNGSLGSAPGCYDDRVMSYSIAREMLREIPAALSSAA